MSLYHDAVSILTTPSSGGSFKSRIYSARLRSPAQVYALIIESAKWDVLLKEVVERTEVLKEPKITPLLALFLVHDHLLSKNGIATAANHPLRQAIEKHKTRLKGEFIKARVRRGCASIDELRGVVLREKAAATGAGIDTTVYPRWVRVNTIRTTLKQQLKGTFASYQRVFSLSDLGQDDAQKRLFIDPHIPDLLAVPPGVEFTTCPAYKNGEIILQDKASCFPAYLLTGDWKCGGDLVDGCAAPGNKTTHLAALATTVKGNDKNGKIFSMDASPTRSKTLQKMVAAAGAGDIVTVMPGQDFLAIDPDTDVKFKNVEGLLLDPSCSGSGIIGRDDVPQLILPSIPNQKQKQKQSSQSKKRKRDSDTHQPTAAASTDENDIPNTTLSKDRLTKLSNIQARIVEHALSFPSATRVTYSTCSTHVIENESVVERMLRSDVARRRGWRVLRRGEQAVDLRGWRYRGVKSDPTSSNGDGMGMEVGLSGEELEGCLRCWPGDEEGVGGFFVVGFVRDGDGRDSRDGQDGQDSDDDGAGSDEWEGFSD